MHNARSAWPVSLIPSSTGKSEDQPPKPGEHLKRKRPEDHITLCHPENPM